MCCGVLLYVGDDSLSRGRRLITIRITSSVRHTFANNSVEFPRTRFWREGTSEGSRLLRLDSTLRRSSGNENRADFTIDRERSTEALWRHREDCFLLDRGA